MERRAVHHIIDFNLMINRPTNLGSSEVADDLINCLRSFQAEISPLLESSPRDHAYITSSAKMSLMSRLCALGCSKTNMTAPDQIRVLQAGFSGDGPFAGVSFPVYRPVGEDPKFLASCYHFVMNHSGNTDEAANHYLMAISTMGFVGGEPYSELLTHLKEAESASFGESRIDALDYLISGIPINARFNNTTAVVLYENGGVDRCIELKVDLQELFRRMVDGLKNCSASLTDLAKIHTFCNQINSHLFKSLEITRIDHQSNAGELLALALDLSKGSEILLDTSPSLSYLSLTANQVIKIASFSSKRDTIMKSWIDGGVFDDHDIKDAVKRLDASVQHQVIDRLELKSLYSPRELNLITGRRLEREMGL